MKVNYLYCSKEISIDRTEPMMFVKNENCRQPKNTSGLFLGLLNEENNLLYVGDQLFKGKVKNFLLSTTTAPMECSFYCDGISLGLHMSFSSFLLLLLSDHSQDGTHTPNIVIPIVIF
jgi:hypothetical protein